jgi:hypothetical protein
LNVSVYRGQTRLEGFVWKDIETVPVSSLTKKIARIAERQTPADEML